LAGPANVIAWARRQVEAKYKEGANNDNIFGAWYGANHVPWCAMYVSWCFHKAGLSPLVAATTPKGFTSCHVGVEWFKKHSQWAPAENAEPGDVIFMNFAHNLNDPEHVGIVYKHDKVKKLIYTYEGNTVNPDGSGDQANGDGAYAKVRGYGIVCGVGKPKWPVDATPGA
jgi:hypothetical protein